MSMMFGYGWGCYCLGLTKVQIKLYWIIVLFLNFFHENLCCGTLYNHLVDKILITTATVFMKK